MLSAFVQNEWQVTPRVSLVTGGRVDRYSLAGAAFSPRGALVLHPGSRSTIKVLYGEAFRAPVPLEQYPDEPGIRAPNLSLGPERVRNMELVWDQKLTVGLHSTVSLFRTSIRDIIDQVLDTELGELIYRNRSSARARGVGVGLFGRSGTRVTYSASWNYQRTQGLGSDRQLVNSPEHLARASATFEVQRGLHLNVRAAYDASRRTYLGQDTEGFALLSAFVTGIDLGPLQGEIGVSNALDRAYTNPAGPEHRLVGIPQDGRALRLALKAIF